MASSVSQQAIVNSAGLNVNQKICGGRYDFEDGGTFCGGWEDNKAHGHGVCTGPKNQGAYFGAWHYGFEVSGVYIWPSGSSYEGHWQNGKRHGLGVETRGRWIYRGEWTQGFKGRYGVRQSVSSTARYEGTWANGLQDGYGSETYADGGSYQGQWLRGMRHGYGVRTSAPFGMAARFRTKNIRASMTSIRSNDGNSNQLISPDAMEKRNHRIDDARGGFVLKAKSDEPPARRNSLVEKTKKGLLSGLKIRKQRSTGDLEKRGAGSGSIRSTASIASWLSTESSQSGMTNKSMHTDSNASFIVEDEQLDGSVTETYMGEWKNDKRCGYGISERSDGLKYEGEWFSNKKYGYGVTTFKDGTKEEGKYKNNVLITSQKKRHLFLIRSAKFRERIDAAIDSAQRASKYALQKADIAISRTATARGKAELADVAADQAREDSDVAIQMAKEFAPDFKPQLLDRFERLKRDRCRLDYSIKPASIEQSKFKAGENVSKQQQSNQVPTGSPLQSQLQQPNFNHDLGSDFYDNGYSNSQQQISNFNTTFKANSRKLSQTFDRKTQQSSATVSNIANNVQSTLIASSKQSAMQSETLNNHQRQLDSNYPERQSYQQLDLDRYQQENITRNSIQTSSSVKPTPMLSQTNQTSIDYFDHYKRPPSRDGSVDRYSRAASRLGGNQSRQSSVDRSGQYIASQVIANEIVPDRSNRAGSQLRGVTPMQNISQNNSSMPTGNGIGPLSPTRAVSPFHQPLSDSGNNQPFEEVLLRQRTLGQDIIPSLSQPKRTESLYLSKPSGLQSEPKGSIGVGIAMSKGGRSAGGAGNGNGMSRAPKSVPVNVTLQRKKSLPDVQQLPFATSTMSREEVSMLGSARREEVRRQIDESERLKANPLLYLVSPKVKDWFSRQQLVMLVLIINIALAIMFFKMLT
ncbi:junctophilin-1 [Sabethes cyaneus]|uniref:junctophilin-1 n=1 Tax=Sabethes cyaneus TaxID=53552 RepID=UPI00237EA2C9|nr:junctophilin-1 [Sabethes cyaneus]